MNVQIINGPNLNLLGTREPHIYGSESLEDIKKWFEGEIDTTSHLVHWFQSNHEGEIIDILHDERHWAQGILLNAGAYTHYSYAIRDAIVAIAIPTVEIHLTDISTREDFRQKSVLESICLDIVKGLGKNSYLEGLKKLLKLNQG